jgi:hypothetical protein
LNPPREHRNWAVCLALFLITVGAFWSVSRCGFVNFDDPGFVTENRHVQQGLTSAGVAWAFRTTFTGNWHPITWISHMLVCQFFGLDPAAHHLVNLLLHTVNSLLLFHLLLQMTRQLWPSALVAAFFALHPLHVESVAWVAERKDVLSTFFGLLTLSAYWRYVQGGAARWIWYGTAVLLLALGLMSKPMLVTWPFVLLLLDYWPLQRMQGFRSPQNVAATPPPKQPISWTRLFLEKLPFFILSLAFCVVTMISQHHQGIVVSVAQVDIWQRIANVMVSYVRYLGKLLWPCQLNVLYLYVDTWGRWVVVGSGALLALISIAVVREAKRRPYLLFGWLWYLGTLVPVIGLVQVSYQAIADRYVYLPSIGLFVMIVWGLKEVAARSSARTRALSAVAIVALAVCAVLTNVQLSYWKNSEALWRRSLVLDPNNFVAHVGLGTPLMQAGDVAEAVFHFEEALRINPGYSRAHLKLADALVLQGRSRESVDHYYDALRYEPDLPDALNNLAWLRATSSDPQLRDGPEAVRLAERACVLTDYTRAIYVGTLAAAYAETGQYHEAVATAEKARELALAAGHQAVARKNEELIRLYEAGQPYHETQSGN